MSIRRTRMALLAARARLALARVGQRVLEQKRDALLRELYREVRVVAVAHAELDAAAAAARSALEEARVWAGFETVAAAAAGAGVGRNVIVEPARVMGVPVPIVEPRGLVRRPIDRGRAVELSGPALELAATQFEEMLTVAVRVATLEVRVRRLAREIRRTSARVNALRTRVVPALEAERRAIAFALEQREREDRYRLKRVKALVRRRPPPTVAGAMVGPEGPSEEAQPPSSPPSRTEATTRRRPRATAP
jgi:V/A-type H+-transporting ATPase subunit D